MERRDNSTGRGKGKARVGSGGQGRGRGSSDEQTSQPILTSHPTIPPERSASTVQSPEMDMEGMATSTPTPTRLPEPKISNLSVPKETGPESSRARSAPVHIPPPNKPNGEGMTYSFQFGSVAPIFETKLESGLFRLYRLEGMDMEGMATSTPTPTRLPEPKISNLSVPKETGTESSRARSAPVHIPPPNKPNGEGMTYSFQFGLVAPIFETKLESGLFRLYRLEGGGKNVLGSSKRPDGGGTNDLVPVNRPDKGNNSTRLVRVNLLANHFPVSFNASQIISHYDLDIKKANGNVTIKNREECVKIKKGLHRTIYNHATIVHDGKRNMYSLENLEPGEEGSAGVYTVNLVEGEERAGKVYTVTVKYTNSKDGGSLSKFLDTKNQHHVNFKDFQDFLQCLELVIREHPSENKLLLGRNLYPNPNQLKQYEDIGDGDITSEGLLLGRSLYPNPNPLKQYEDIGDGAITSEGFYQSLRPTAQGLVLIVDLSVGTFYKSISVIDYLKECPVDFQKLYNLNEEQRRYAEKVLKGLKIRVTHRKGCSPKYTIRGLTKQITRDITFDLKSDDINGPEKRVRLVDFFKKNYKHTIKYDRLPCLDLSKSGNKPNYVPMELCKLCEGQRFRRDKDKDIQGKGCKSPWDRRQSIVNIMTREDGPTKGPFVSHFQLTVGASMTKVRGRVLEAPTLTLKDQNGKDQMVNPGKENPTWNLVNRGVFDGKPIENWCLINFARSNEASRHQNSVIEKFASSLVTRCRELGIEMSKVPLQGFRFYQYSMAIFDNAKDLQEKLSTVHKVQNVKKDQLLLVICVMETRHPGYDTLKRIAETKIGLVTQCCLFEKIKKCFDYRKASQYLANLALKMNAKMGGSNFALSDSVSGSRNSDLSEVMYIGADVNHPNPGDNDSPSVAAVVGSINWPVSNRYIAKIRYQKNRTEQIEELRDMSKELLCDYLENSENRRLPKKIIFFRDGVSEGEFDMVLSKELQALKEAVAQFKDYQPLISIIVAQKRHHTRLFLDELSTKVGNVPAGTVVDTVIVHPRQFDFYLCSHYGFTGTSKPTHYHVLMDENKFTSERLQRLINNLCYTYARCTKPVSLVTPVYYAHLAAYRGRRYLHGLSLTSPSSSTAETASTSSAFSSGHYRNYLEIQKPVKNTMFFC